MRDQSSLWRPALALGLIGLAAALLLGGLDQLTGERIADQRRGHALRSVSAMLPPGSYDNDLLEDRVQIDIAGLAQPALVYRARRSGQPVAAVFDLTTQAGYSGPIRLLVAVDIEGQVLGVRVLEHRETPGLGDKIERARSDWIEQFDGRALGNPPAPGWAPDRRGGEFDTITSATITSTAVVDAVRLALETLRSRAEEVLAPHSNAP